MTTASYRVNRLINKIQLVFLGRIVSWSFLRAPKLYSLPGFIRLTPMTKFTPMRYHENPIQAFQFLRIANKDHWGHVKKVDLKLLERAVEFNYLSWPRRIFTYVHGKDILDIGCGTGLHAIGYAVVGVRGYTGVDPKVNLESDIGKNLRTRQWEHFGWTPQDIMQQLPHIRLIPGTVEELAPEDTFDVVVLHNVTEHVHNLEEIFREIAIRLRRNGEIVFNHHNYYSWDGHHKIPKFVSDLDPNDPEQQKYVDWRHLRLAESRSDELSAKLNKIRMDELRSLTDKYFVVKTWKEILSGSDKGAGRLNEKIRHAFPQYQEREFLTQHVFCVAMASKRKNS
jgi:SAM-dependent methyltransferase